MNKSKQIKELTEIAKDTVEKYWEETHKKYKNPEDAVAHAILDAGYTKFSKKKLSNLIIRRLLCEKECKGCEYEEICKGIK